jgi:hypothetical protein
VSNNQQAKISIKKLNQRLDKLRLNLKEESKEEVKSEIKLVGSKRQHIMSKLTDVEKEQIAIEE